MPPDEPRQNDRTNQRAAASQVDAARIGQRQAEPPPPRGADETQVQQVARGPAIADGPAAQLHDRLPHVVRMRRRGHRRAEAYSDAIGNPLRPFQVKAATLETEDAAP